MRRPEELLEHALGEELTAAGSVGSWQSAAVREPSAVALNAGLAKRAMSRTMAHVSVARAHQA
jgi:hypothetical protein